MGELKIITFNLTVISFESSTLCMSQFNSEQIYLESIEAKKNYLENKIQFLTVGFEMG